MVVLVGLVLLGPHVGQEATTYRHQPDARVVVALDRTASMAVRDAGSGSRWEQAVDDLRRLVAAEPDTTFALVTWAEDARVAVPFTTDSGSLAELAGAAGTARPVDGVGSSVDRPLPTIERVVRRSVAQHPDRETFLLLLSDGENTTGGAQRSFAGLASSLGGGLVVGYGTEDGGPVPLDPGEDSGFVPAPDGAGPAVSRRGSAALQQVADELDVEYRAREEVASTAELADALRPSPRLAVGGVAARDVSWLLGLALLALVAAELRTSSAGVRELRSMRSAR
jgi:Ca-activated chloride channel family protein